MLIGLISCEEETQKKIDTTPKVEEEQLVEVKDGMYREYYPGKKQLKFEGMQDRITSYNVCYTKLLRSFPYSKP